MRIIFNNTLVSSNKTITLIKNSAQQIYQIYCSSSNSNPDVNLTLYDTNSLIPLTSGSNYFIQKSCNLSLCQNVLKVDFQFKDDRFNNMTSFTCAANSSNPAVQLVSSISQNVSVIIQGKALTHIFFSNKHAYIFSLKIVNTGSNSTQLIGDIGTSFSINCDGPEINSANVFVAWIHTINKTGAYLLQNSSEVSFNSNGRQLSFGALKLSNDEYYSCGFLSNNRFEIVNNYYLFIRGFDFFLKKFFSFYL
jgi:hypothetical protein